MSLSQWSDGAYGSRSIPVPDLPTAFETRCGELGLNGKPGEWAASIKLRAWVKTHRNLRYVPEWLLEELGLDVTIHES